MGNPLNQEEIKARLRLVAVRDGRYAVGAFHFVADAIKETVQWLQNGELEPRDVTDWRGDGRESYHVSGFELLAGIKKLARGRWGCMARLVLESWGVRCTEDIGEIVFLMVEDEELGWRKRDQDSREDFRSGFDFTVAFDPWED